MIPLRLLRIIPRLFPTLWPSSCSFPFGMLDFALVMGISLWKSGEGISCSADKRTQEELSLQIYSSWVLGRQGHEKLGQTGRSRLTFTRGGRVRPTNPEAHGFIFARMTSWARGDLVGGEIIPRPYGGAAPM